MKEFWKEFLKQFLVLVGQSLCPMAQIGLS
jgi:hypothetical protein